jgi:hypothetical protein
MPCHCSLMPIQGILRLRYHGNVNARERLEALDQVFRTCKNQSITKLLVDFTDQESPTVAMDVTTLSSTLAGANLPGSIRIAFIFPKDVRPEAVTEPFSKKRALESKVFSSPDAGCLWLSEC